MDETVLITYKDLLHSIGNTENHLLIANGFNYSLGIHTGYKDIFTQMKKNNSIYEDADDLFLESKYDLEHFLGRLEKNIISDNFFLRKYVKNKIKLDFMQATQEIVKRNIKNVFADKNEGIFLLLNKFTNYFTLNYDPFLYMLLLKYKPKEDDKKNTIIFPANIKFIKEMFDNQSDTLYSIIKEARDKGVLNIFLKDELLLGNESSEMKKLTKTEFHSAVSIYKRKNHKKWTSNDINKAINLVFQDEVLSHFINNIDDGFRQKNLFGEQEEYVFLKKKTQNLFFLHGAFHIFFDGDKYKKITQEKDKALYDRLEEVLNTEGQDIVCVFQNEDKASAIKGNAYLNNNLKKLETLLGSLVIIGSSLDQNDNHVFNIINSSSIDTIYISVMKDLKDEMYEKATRAFPDKKFILFDAESITYDNAGIQDLIED